MPSGAFKRLSIRSKIGPEGLNDPQLFRCWEQSEFGNCHDLSLLLRTYPVNFLPLQGYHLWFYRPSVFSLNLTTPRTPSVYLGWIRFQNWQKSRSWLPFREEEKGKEQG